jgi:hypothetical protein
MPEVKVNPKVAIGLTSAIGFLAAAAQYLGVLVGLIDDGHLDATELGVLATATATLYGTIQGRMKQASAAIATGVGIQLLPPSDPGPNRGEVGQTNYTLIGVLALVAIAVILGIALL